MSFDLTKEYGAYRNRMRVAVFMRAGFYTFMVGLSALLIWVGMDRDDPVGFLFGIPFLVLAGLGFSVLRVVYRGADGLAVANEGITFRMVPPGGFLMAWQDPRFGLRLTETSREVNMAGESPVDHATYRLFTGRGSGVGPGTRVLSDVPLECVRAILLESIARGLSVVEGREGVAGTMSERRTWRITTGPPPLGYPPSVP